MNESSTWTEWCKNIWKFLPWMVPGTAKNFLCSMILQSVDRHRLCYVCDVTARQPISCQQHSPTANRKPAPLTCVCRHWVIVMGRKILKVMISLQMQLRQRKYFCLNLFGCLIHSFCNLHFQSDALHSIEYKLSSATYPLCRLPLCVHWFQYSSFLSAWKWSLFHPPRFNKILNAFKAINLTISIIN